MPRWLSRVDDADVAGPHGRGEARFFDALQHGLVKLAVGVQVAPQDVVLDGFPCLIRNQTRLVYIVAGKQVLATQSGFVIIAKAVDDLGALPLESDVKGSDLGL